MNKNNPNDNFFKSKVVAVKRRFALKKIGVRSTVTKFRDEKGVVYRLRIHKEEINA